MVVMFADHPEEGSHLSAASITPCTVQGGLRRTCPPCCNTSSKPVTNLPHAMWKLAIVLQKRCVQDSEETHNIRELDRLLNVVRQRSEPAFR